MKTSYLHDCSWLLVPPVFLHSSSCACQYKNSHLFVSLRLLPPLALCATSRSPLFRDNDPLPSVYRLQRLRNGLQKREGCSPVLRRWPTIRRPLCSGKNSCPAADERTIFPLSPILRGRANLRQPKIQNQPIWYAAGLTTSAGGGRAPDFPPGGGAVQLLSWSWTPRNGAHGSQGASPSPERLGLYFRSFLEAPNISAAVRL